MKLILLLSFIFPAMVTINSHADEASNDRSNYYDCWECVAECASVGAGARRYTGVGYSRQNIQNDYNECLAAAEKDCHSQTTDYTRMLSNNFVGMSACYPNTEQ